MKYRNKSFVIPSGYRILRKGSRIQKGDKFVFAYCDDNDWYDVKSSVGTVYNESNSDNIKPSNYIVITARPIRKRKPKMTVENMIPEGWEPVKVGDIIKPGDRYLEPHFGYRDCTVGGSIGMICNSIRPWNIIRKKPTPIKINNNNNNNIDNSVDLTDDNFKGTLCVRHFGNLQYKSFYLDDLFNWAIVKDDRGQECLVPTKKN